MTCDATTQYHISQAGAERMLRLAEFLDLLPRERFDFSITREEYSAEDAEAGETVCGTVGCAIGWCPNALPELCTVTNGSKDPGTFAPVFAVRGEQLDAAYDWARVGEKLFEITYNDSHALFTPWQNAPHDGSYLTGRASPKDVSRRLRRYVEWALVTPSHVSGCPNEPGQPDDVENDDF